MADSSKEELIQLIKRVGACLTVKMSNILSTPFQFQNVRSIGAFAGLALAVIFTWKFLRTPAPRQRKQSKRQRVTPSTSTAIPQSNANMSSSLVCSTSEDSRAQHIVDEFFQPVKVSLQKHVTVRSSVLEVLLEITKYCDLYLMESILDDESEVKVLMALEDAGIFSSGGIVKEKVLFCSTENGRISFVRQLEPDWHIDTNFEIISQLAHFIKYQLHISPIRPERMASNVFSCGSLEQFISCPS
ncbi:Peroxisome biogenesis protein 22 [Acorus gramineus]|uniref:Peroxisome biogenesis protein 22 n=1 Tax=Acorus gramineus TaxID=55184 RepID=A0AAV9AAH9_ACOGR|nr:Peroxisome biogenesis protein 22 [Acorus gramineus]